MSRIAIAFLDRTLAVEAPASIAPDIAAFFQLCTEADADAAVSQAVVSETTNGTYDLDIDSARVASDQSRGEIIKRLSAHAGVELSYGRRGVAIRSGAVAWADKAILVAAEPGAGQTSLIAWFIEKGFAYVGDDSVSVLDDSRIAGMPLPLAFHRGEAGHLAELGSFRDVASVAAGKDHLLLRPDITWMAGSDALPCGLILLARHKPKATFAVEAIAPDKATLVLLEKTRSVVIPSDPQYAAVRSLAEAAPVLRTTYGEYPQLEGVLDLLARLAVESDVTAAEFTRLIGGLARPAPAATPAKKTYPVPERSDRHFSPKLTIGMATYDDFDGVYFSIQSIRIFHPEILDQVEFLVIDNHPDGPCAEPLKKLEKSIPNYRYIPFSEGTGTTTARDRVFVEAGGEFVLCMDCHVMIVPGALRRLLDYLAANPDTNDLLQGPILYDDLKTISTNYQRKWQAGYFGVWGTDAAGADPDGPPFDIEQQGLGLWVCRRTAWPGFNPLFRGFGGGEGYIHEKFRRLGRRTLCLPFLRWVHRFPRPMGVPFKNTWLDRIRNYTIGFRELGWPMDEMHAHYREVLGAAHAEKIFAMIEEELANVGRP